MVKYSDKNIRIHIFFVNEVLTILLNIHVLLGIHKIKIIV